MDKPKENVAYKLHGHIAATGFKSVFNKAFFIDGEWYVPKRADIEEGEIEHSQPDDIEKEIGWDFDILPDDYVVDSYDKVTNDDKK